ncbi:trypsin-like peptidase domain-containing protein [Jatrophihabitans telluris]|uniref:Trypsin-like peptidase domain-containing protein n=1 Tax=Jatrophihabitans telluris TaxID=2038343 RepID=A0ABY4R0D6_9ACTN|nr:trypsin-like peptidase domain-containing protein [Jatrophihabitans telluris]UQX88731.1 trypsin-like peptidase domain-containing protein [Jatrophihabitans telluris]
MNDQPTPEANDPRPADTQGDRPGAQPPVTARPVGPTDDYGAPSFYHQTRGYGEGPATEATGDAQAQYPAPPSQLDEANQPYPSQPLGQPNPSQPYPSQPFGQAYASQAYPSQAYPSQAYPSQAYPSQAYPSQAYPSQAFGQPDPYQPNPYGGQQYWAPANYWAPPQPHQSVAAGTGANVPRHRRVLIGSVAAACAVGLTVGAVAYSVAQSNRNSTAQTSVTAPAQSGTGSSGSSGSDGTSGGTSGGGQFGWSNPFGSNGLGNSGSSGTSSTATKATAAQSKGVVDINTVLDYGTGKAAGTGIVLNSDGTILTNNHVVQGSTSISVTVVSTGKTYTATVVGTDPTDDVAVLKLANASGLTTASLGNSSAVAAGDKVTAVGNAGGTGGTPSAAAGSVTALDQSITASDSDGSNAEKLTGMIQVDADIQAGDSGGPLYNSAGQVIGIDTAASSSQSSQTVGFAVPIAKATSLASQILSGTDNSTIHQGYPAFLGVQLSAQASSSTAGVPVAGVVANSAAAKAGLAQGDTITGINGTVVNTATGLSGLLAKHNPGDTITVKWVDANGASHTASVTLGSGPAD